MATVMVEAKEAVIRDQLGMLVDMLVLPADFVTNDAAEELLLDTLTGLSRSV